MKKNLGVIEKKEKRVPAFLTGTLAMVLIVSFIFTLKNYEPANNIIITGGIIVYPLSFLLTAIICKYYGFKETRKSIYISSLLYIIFMVLTLLAIFPKSNEMTMGYNAVVQYVFANNFVDLNKNLTIFYPTLGQFFGVVVAFLVSHLLFATIYNAIKRFTVDYLAVALGLFIGYIVDRLLFVPILYAKGLINGFNTFEYLIQCLTSEFIASVFMTIIIILVYTIITGIKKSED